MRMISAHNFILLFVLVVCVIPAPGIADTSVLRNGSFSDGLSEWILSPDLVDWSPLTPDMAVRLSPPVDGFRGAVLYQNLNVGEIAGRQFHLYFWLKKLSGWTGHTVAVYADYTDSTGHIQRQKVFSPANDSVIYNDWTVFSHLFTFPSDARRLVRLSLSKEGYGIFDLDGIMLLAEGVVPVGVVPRVTGISPSEGVSGTTVTIDGTSFGTNASGNGRVLIGGSADGMSILSWTGSRIVARTGEGTRGGRVSVVADDVESDGDFQFVSLSPCLKLRVIESSQRVIRGQTAGYTVRADFANGFRSRTGVTFAVPEAPTGSVAVSPLPLEYTGGVRLQISTSGLSNGLHHWTLQAIESGIVVATAPLTLQVVGVSDVEFYFREPDGTKAIITSPVTVTKQQRLYVHARAMGTDGLPFPEDTGINLVSDHIYLHVFPVRWGGWEVYVAANLSGLLTANCPDGFSKSVAIASSVSGNPVIQSMGLSPASVTNRGDQTMTYMVSAAAPVDGRFDYAVGALENYNYWWTNEDRTFNATGRVPEGLTPGTYLFHAWLRSDPSTERVRPLAVLNDPARGIVKGSVHCVDIYWEADPDGVLELFDQSGERVAEFPIAHWGAFVMPYVSPGTYRARLVPRAGLEAQWHPNCHAFSVAGAFDVVAGGTVDGVDFFLYARDESAPVVVGTDPLDGAASVPVDAIVTALFSKPMDVSSVNSSTFHLQEASGEPVPGSVASDGITAHFTPSKPLSLGATYTATVTGAVRDTGGTPMSVDYSWSFTAGSNSLADVTSLPNGSRVSLTGKGLYYLQGGVGYVSEPSRACGIRAEGIIPLTVGDEVSLSGVVDTTAGGEKFIALESISKTGTITIRPLGANLRSLKQPMMGGLHVTVWGRVMEDSVTPLGFRVNDGSDAQGIKVVTTGSPGAQEGDFVVVSGAAGYDNERVIYSE